MFGMISQAASNVCTYMCRESGRSPAMVSTRPCWARLHDDLAAARLRQRQIMKHEQAMNDSKNRTDTLQFARRGQPVHEPRRRACLAFACLVFRPLRCGDLGAISALMDQAGGPDCRADPL